MAKDKKKLFDKLQESDKIDKLILKVNNIYHNISDKLLIKYDLKNELKQGKLFTILIAILAFIFLIIITAFFVIMLNSLLGLNFIFSIIKYTLFILKWSYTILKNKGNVIKKYLANLFPNSKLLNTTKEDELLIDYQNLILEEVDDLIEKVSNMNIDLKTKKEILIKIKEKINSLKLEESLELKPLLNETLNKNILQGEQLRMNFDDDLLDDNIYNIACKVYKKRKNS
ncbi:MAG: hypothetical protein IJ501_05185 [Bacilli bacterium]|nr:hypothetical protein [Bacilli bacterium]